MTHLSTILLLSTCHYAPSEAGPVGGPALDTGDGAPPPTEPPGADHGAPADAPGILDRLDMEGASVRYTDGSASVEFVVKTKRGAEMHLSCDFPKGLLPGYGFTSALMSLGAAFGETVSADEPGDGFEPA